METREQMEAELREHGQEQVLRFWDEIDQEGRAQLLQQISDLDLSALGAVFTAKEEELDPELVAPYSEVIRRSDTGRSDAKAAGEAALAAGRVGTLLVAGGQGSRLGFDGPKGAFLLGSVSKRSLFEIHVQRLLALGRRHGQVPPLYVMTSDTNHQQTLDCFSSAKNFGLPPERLFIFQQGLAPALDTSGRVLLAAKDSLLLVPNGNGGLFAALEDSGAFAHMKTHGVDVISYVHVDNPLARSCDPVFVGYHLQRDCQYSCKTLAKTGPHEKVGNYALVQGRLGIIEYNDIPDDMVSARDEKQELLFGWGSPGFFLFSRSFAEKQAARTDLPVHKAHKKLRHLGADGKLVDPEAPNAIKLETYAHDTLLDAKHTLVLECERASEFAPVKNATGVDSAQSARELMTALYRGWLEEAGATIVGNPQLEISPIRALDAEDLLASGAGELRIEGDTYLE